MKILLYLCVILGLVRLGPSESFAAPDSSPASSITFEGEGTTEIAALKDAEAKSKAIRAKPYFLSMKIVSYDEKTGWTKVRLTYRPKK